MMFLIVPVVVILGLVFPALWFIPLVLVLGVANSLVTSLPGWFLLGAPLLFLAITIYRDFYC